MGDGSLAHQLATGLEYFDPWQNCIVTSGCIKDRFNRVILSVMASLLPTAF